MLVTYEPVTMAGKPTKQQSLVSFTYIVIYPENEKYLKKYFKYFSKVFVFKYICM